jgi:hypothetical protein
MLGVIYKTKKQQKEPVWSERGKHDDTGQTRLMDLLFLMPQPEFRYKLKRLSA